MAGSGTEAFPELGAHCQHSDCNQLDFLPFTCDACLKVFCLEHRTTKSHQCPKPDHKSRRVFVCETCSMSIEITDDGKDNEKAIQEKHDRSGDCDASKKKKPTCSVKRCKEILTFSNTSTCKACHTKVCLKHRFPADHASAGHQWHISILLGVHLSNLSCMFKCSFLTVGTWKCILQHIIQMF